MMYNLYSTVFSFGFIVQVVVTNQVTTRIGHLQSAVSSSHEKSQGQEVSSTSIGKFDMHMNWSKQCLCVY